MEKIPIVIDVSGVENPHRAEMHEIESKYLRELLLETRKEVARLTQLLAVRGYNKRGELSLNPWKDNEEVT